MKTFQFIHCEICYVRPYIDMGNEVPQDSISCRLVSITLHDLLMFYNKN